MGSKAPQHAASSTLTPAVQLCNYCCMVDPLPEPHSIKDLSLARELTDGAYGLDELLAVAGERLGEELSPRTVRLYATQGLIDRPGKEGRSAVYGQRHLLQLLLIRSLARRGLSLAAIAPLCVLTNAELKQQLIQLDTPTETKEQEGNEALDYLLGLKASGLSNPIHQASQQFLSLIGSPLTPSRPPSRSPSRSSGSRDAASRWHRFSLAPGVELHISDSVSIPPAGSRRINWLQRLADRLIEQLDERQS